MPKLKNSSTQRAVDVFMAQQEPGQDLPGARLLPLDLLDGSHFQPRVTMDADRLAELTASVGAHGVLQPIAVRAAGARFEIIAGHRRVAAARAAGLDAIPAVILDRVADDAAMLYTATENLQREDLTLAEEAQMFGALLARGVARSNRQLAQLLGVSTSRVDRATRLLPYPQLIHAITAGEVGLVAGLKLLDQADLVIQVEQGLLDAATAVRLASAPAPVKLATTPLTPDAGAPGPPLPRLLPPPPVEAVGWTRPDAIAAPVPHSSPPLFRPLPAPVRPDVPILPPMGAVPFYSEDEWNPPPARRWKVVVAARVWAEQFDPLSVPVADRAALLEELDTARARLSRLADTLRSAPVSDADGAGVHL